MQTLVIMPELPLHLRRTGIHFPSAQRGVQALSIMAATNNEPVRVVTDLNSFSGRIHDWLAKVDPQQRAIIPSPRIELPPLGSTMISQLYRQLDELGFEPEYTGRDINARYRIPVS